MATARDVAQFLLKLVQAEGVLHHQDAVSAIEEEFGLPFLTENELGNLVIDRSVLREFMEISRDTVVWVKTERFWRLREPDDEVDRREAER